MTGELDGSGHDARRRRPVTGLRRENRVGVLGGLGIDPPQKLSGAGRRALAYLAAHGPVVQRSLMCMHLWPDAPETRSRANLRRALWELPPGWVSTTGWDLRLDARVDLDDARLLTWAVLNREPLALAQIELLKHDVLPGWYEDWLAPVQDEFHLQRVQALEEACRYATETKHHCIATMTGLAAVSAEPLRESAVLALVEAHLGEGNRYEAVRRYREYARQLQEELRVAPGARLAGLMAPLVGRAEPPESDPRLPTQWPQ